MNRYSKYWQTQFDTLAVWLQEIDSSASGVPAGAKSNRRARKTKSQK
jgi:hypothetical protein